MTEAALARVKAEQAERVRANRRRREWVAQSTHRSVRSFKLPWSDLSGWTQGVLPRGDREGLSDAEWGAFTLTQHETGEFADAARRGRKADGR